ncbi:MAG: protein kinase domain-containing protein, partial [Phycisphaerae bacterium]
MISPEQHKKVAEVLTELEDLPESERDTAIERLCGNDWVIRREVESLLDFDDDRTGDFVNALEKGNAPEIVAEMLSNSLLGNDATRPESIGRYHIIELLGEGGMGVVYKAQQDQPNRLVALKVIRSGFATPQLMRRFQREVEVHGLLQHPGIAHIYEAG